MKNLKKISIRCRFAIGLHCAKTILREQGLIQDEFYYTLMRKTGGFTHYQDICLWAAESDYYCYGLAKNKTGKEVFDTFKNMQKNNALQKNHADEWVRKQYTPLEVLDENFYNQLVIFYENDAHQEIKDILSKCADIATTELYCGMSLGNSKHTLKIIEEILELTQLQDMFDFEQLSRNYPFKTKSNCNSIVGWGEPFTFKGFNQ